MPLSGPTPGAAGDRHQTAGPLPATGRPRPDPIHVVWDWNGTLLDDTDLIVACSAQVCTALGFTGLDRQLWRATSTRPMRQTYANILGRSLSTAEWHQLQADWLAAYHRGQGTVQLAADAIAALQAVRDRGWGQSLVSMTPRDYLADQLASYQLEHFFTAVAGPPFQAGPGDGPAKSIVLADHLAALSLAAETITVIGDNPDDATAASQVGAAAILVATGDATAERLAATGFPVTANLTAAIDHLTSS